MTARSHPEGPKSAKWVSELWLEGWTSIDQMQGTVLTKATEYIHYLERRNKQIMQEHRKLSQRLQAFEQLLSATARPTYQMPSYSRALFDPRGFC